MFTLPLEKWNGCVPQTSCEVLSGKASSLCAFLCLVVSASQWDYWHVLCISSQIPTFTDSRTKDSPPTVLDGRPIWFSCSEERRGGWLSTHCDQYLCWWKAVCIVVHPDKEPTFGANVLYWSKSSQKTHQGRQRPGIYPKTSHTNSPWSFYCSVSKKSLFAFIVASRGCRQTDDAHVGVQTGRTARFQHRNEEKKHNERVVRAQGMRCREKRSWGLNQTLWNTRRQQ